MPSAPSLDPRNEDDFDTWTYGTEPIPYDPTWTSPMHESINSVAASPTKPPTPTDP